jgi:hypothetical protein
MGAESGRTYRTMTGAKKRARKRRTIRLVVIPEPEKGTRSVLIFNGEGTLAMRLAGTSGPPVTMVCGNCSAPLTEGITVDQVQNLVFRCNRCGAFNETLIS